MFLKYISVGLFNTILTFAVMSLLYFLWGVNYLIAYAVGYGAGYVSSLVLNNIFTFKAYKNRFDMDYFLRFTLFFLLAFLLSKGFVIISVEFFHLSVYLAFLAGMVVYTFSSYWMFKQYVYKEKNDD